MAGKTLRELRVKLLSLRLPSRDRIECHCKEYSQRTGVLDLERAIESSSSLETRPSFARQLQSKAEERLRSIALDRVVATSDFADADPDLVINAPDLFAVVGECNGDNMVENSDRVSHDDNISNGDDVVSGGKDKAVVTAAESVAATLSLVTASSARATARSAITSFQ